jgi:upstream activation factor subunit UAF30
VIEESESDQDEKPNDGGGSDYEPDAEILPKKKTGTQRGVRASNKTRKRRGSASFTDDEEGSGSSGEEWGKKRRKGKGRRKRKLSDSDEASFSSDDSDAGKKKYKDKTPLTGFTKPLKLSEDLEEIVGLKEASRGEVIKQMWAYIKENKLQDPKNKQFAICDDKLEKVIGEKKFKCFGMAKYLKDHMTKK